MERLARLRFPVHVFALLGILAPPGAGAVPAQPAPPGDTRSQESTGEAAPAPAKTFAERVAGLTRAEGFVPFYWDGETGHLLLEITRFERELLYQVSLAAGVGSNPLGLDRGQLGATHVVVFERVGPKVLMVQRNYRYRALTGNAAEQRAVDDSFARSVLWGFRVEAADGERVLVDATSFFLRDAHGVADRLREAQQGSYRLDESRSAIHLPRTRSFPKNTEIEATITLVTDETPGPLVRQVTPSPRSVTVRQHHSFVELPPLGADGYRPRAADPRVGYIDLEFNDYASPITEPVERRWIVRHHIEKKDASAEVSDPVEPIVYYVDTGAPEPIRSALVEGASWWNEAFEAAGFRNGFQVRVLPEGADPMDIRYNMINWVHRSTRGWSYGGSVVDPRTGQILKGNVTLGSLRVRQDYLLGTGLVPTGAGSGSGAAPDGAGHACDAGSVLDDEALLPLDPASDPEAMALARIRQLSAHEVGHTIGLEHNFAASTYGRASVMDYPAPLVTIRDGRLDLSDAYTTGIGAYDVFAIRYGYAQFAPGADEAAELASIVRDGLLAGLVFVSDDDSRPPGAAHPLGNLWDNGKEPIEGLRHAMEVRRLALSRFGLDNLPEGAPLSLLETRLLPLYLHHRFEVQAAAKYIGGLYFSYSVKARGAVEPSPVQQVPPAARQRAALEAVLDTLAPEFLALPPSVLALIPPRAFSFGGTNTELFPGRTEPVFDPLAAAAIAADLSVSVLLQPERAARASDFHARDRANVGFDEVVAALLDRTWLAPPAASSPLVAIAETVQSVVVSRLMDLAADATASSRVRAEATAGLRTLRRRLEAGTAGAGTTAAHRQATIDEIARFLARPDAPQRRTPPLPTPPGEPIG